MSFYSIKISEIKSRKKGKKLCVITFSKRLRENLGKKGKKKSILFFEQFGGPFTTFNFQKAHIIFSK